MAGEILTIDMRAEVLLARLQGAAPRMHADLVRVMRKLAIDLQGSVKEGKLSGQVLHVRTGTLRRSINQRVADYGETVIATVGTNVRYAHVHEYGFDGQVDVRAHARHVNGREVPVRAHQRMVHLPERSFLRSALREMAPKITADIRAAVRKSLQ